MSDEEEILSSWILKYLSTGNVIRLKIGELKVGRSPSCDIILVSSLVSKHHCNLFVSEKRVILTDFSSNGVFVNTNKYKDTTTVIEKDDRIGFGCETFNKECLNDPDRYPIFYLKHDPIQENNETNMGNKNNIEQNQIQLIEQAKSIDSGHQEIAENIEKFNQNENNVKIRKPLIIEISDSSDEEDSDINYDKPKSIVNKNDNSSISGKNIKPSSCDSGSTTNSDKHNHIADKSDGATDSSKCITNRRKSAKETVNHDCIQNSIKSEPSTCNIDPKFNSECSDVINDERMPTISDAIDQINPISDLNKIKNENCESIDLTSYDDNYDNIDVEFSQCILHEIKQEVIDLENEESVIDDCRNIKIDRSEDEKVTNDNDQQHAVSPLFNEECDNDDEEERDIEQCALKWLTKLSQSQTIIEKKEMIQKQQSSVTENEKIQKRKVPEIIEAPSLPTTKGKLRGISAAIENKLKRKPQDNLTAVPSKIKKTEQEAELKRKFHQKPSVIQRKQKEKNEKLKQDRKEKLKKLATNQKNKRKSSDDDDVKIVMKPKVKVTYKNRGAFLTEEHPSTSKILPSKVSIIEKKNCSSNNNKMHNHNTIEKKLSDVSNGKSNGNHSNLTDNLKSIMKKPNSSCRKSNLHVRFNDSPDIKQYFIEDDSNLNVKINNKIKDAPTPNSFEKILKLNDKDKIIQLHKTNQAKRRNQMPIIDNFYEILSEVLNWNPNWLETGKHEIIGAGKILLPILHAFSSFDEFRRTLFPLMKLEFWASIEHDYKNRKLDSKPYLYENLELFNSSLEYKDKTITFLCSYYVNNSTVNKTIFNIGDLCLMKISDQIYFAYVRGVYKRHFSLNDTHYEIAVEAAKNPNLIKLLSIKNQKIQLKSITIIKVELSSFNAIYSLKYSPLMNNIINPLENTKLKDLKTDDICYIGRDSLNDNQKCALLKTYLHCIDYDNPSISLIQGPPGTGKSRVIANLAMQLLYGREVAKLQNKILICSQSNAAIDVICLKLLHIRNRMTTDKFNLVRFGILERMHPRVKTISVQNLIEKDQTKLLKANDVNSSLNKEKLFLEEKIANLKKMQNLHDNINSDKLEEAIKDLQRIEKLQNNKLSPTDKALQYTRFLSGANIVCTTLSSAIKLLQHAKYFDVCIIDEATQCTEQLSLTPLQFGISSLVLVGDTQQLPATVLSKKAKEYGLGRSLFTRIQNCIEGKNNNNCILTLTEQYRMHPEISHWPNAYFYNGMLTNAPETLTNHLNIKPYTLYNLKNYQNSGITNGQICNDEEVKFITDIIKGLIPLFPLNKYEFGVITPYAKQRDIIRYELRKEFNNVGIMVDTIDSYQGKEKDVIIISMARTEGIGFLAHPQRLNVALTRAKKCLIVCGNFTNIERITPWKSLIEDARKRNVLIDVNKNFDVQNEVIPFLKL